MVPWGDSQALSMLQRKLDVDILITGHTHEYKVSPSHDASCTFLLFGNNVTSFHDH